MQLAIPVPRGGANDLSSWNIDRSCLLAIRIGQGLPGPPEGDTPDPVYHDDGLALVDEGTMHMWHGNGGLVSDESQSGGPVLTMKCLEMATHGPFRRKNRAEVLKARSVRKRRRNVSLMAKLPVPSCWVAVLSTGGSYAIATSVFEVKAFSLWGMDVYD